jgi:hypothetical protein
VNSIEGPEMAFGNWQLFGAIRNPSGSDRRKTIGTTIRNCI